jgi:glucose-6-phosphate isomerase
MIKVDLTKTGLEPLNKLIDETKIKEIHQKIFNKTGAGNDYLG